jgi:hypothetical protein
MCRTYADIGCQRARTLEARRVSEFGNDHGCGGVADAANAGYRAAITQWIHWYNAERPHQALGYLSPRQFRAAT